MRFRMKPNHAVWVALSSIALVGCGPQAGDNGEAPSRGTASIAVPKVLPKIAADAGVPLVPPADPGFVRTKLLATSARFPSRRDAFALMSPETKFEQDQLRERILGEMGGFSTLYELPTPPPDEEETLERQPFRRLVGVLLGEGVIALIQMEDGKIYDVRPGSKIPNSEWTVVSIDSEKAVLRRSGNKRPREIVVLLQGQPSGMTSPGQNTGGGNLGPPIGGGGAPGAAGAGGSPGAAGGG